MSVLACGRRGCGNAMCDRLILENTTYICNRCFAELKLARESWPSEMTGRQVKMFIANFMESEVGEYRLLTGDELEEAFNRYTGGG